MSNLISLSFHFVLCLFVIEVLISGVQINESQKCLVDSSRELTPCSPVHLKGNQVLDRSVGRDIHKQIVLIVHFKLGSQCTIHKALWARSENVSHPFQAPDPYIHNLTGRYYIWYYMVKKFKFKKYECTDKTDLKK